MRALDGKETALAVSTVCSGAAIQAHILLALIRLLAGVIANIGNGADQGIIFAGFFPFMGQAAAFFAWIFNRISMYAVFLYWQEIIISKKGAH